MNQKNGETDVCEHFFAKTRQGNPCPTLQQCREITSKISGLNISSNHMFNFKSKSNTAGVKREHSDYLQKISSRKRIIK